MNQLWNAILDLLAKVVSPDWGSLVGLLPLAVAAVVALFLLWVAASFAAADPTRRGRQRLRPLPPPGVHEGQPSIAPLLVAVAAAVLFFGVVFRGPILIAGIVLLVASLLYWGREAMRDYERLDRHAAPAEPAGPRPLEWLETLGGAPSPPRLGAGAMAATAQAASRSVVESGAGHTAHIPVPSFRPVLVSVGAFVLFLGLVFGGAILVAGLLMLLVSLLGWLSDARAEYRALTVADRTGHPPAASRPGAPVKTLVLFAVLFVFAVAVRDGLLPPGSSAAGGGTGASASAGASATTPPAGGSQPAGGGQGAAATLRITAKNIVFEEQSLNAPTSAFTIDFTNQDAGVPHNVTLYKGSPSGQQVWQGSNLTGPGSTTYHVPALPAGTYAFVCSIHPTTMHGTLTVH